MAFKLPNSKDKLLSVVFGLSPDEVELVRNELKKKSKSPLYREIFEKCLTSETGFEYLKKFADEKKLRNARHNLTKRIQKILIDKESKVRANAFQRVHQANVLLKKGNFRLSYNMAYQELKVLSESEDFEYKNEFVDVCLESWSNLEKGELGKLRNETQMLIDSLALKESEFNLQKHIYYYQFIPAMKGIGQNGILDFQNFQSLGADLENNPAPQNSWKASALYHYTIGIFYFFGQYVKESEKHLEKVVNLLQSKSELPILLERILLNASFRNILIQVENEQFDEAQALISELEQRAAKGNIELMWRYLLGLLILTEATMEGNLFDKARAYFLKNLFPFFFGLKPVDFGNLAFFLFKVSILTKQPIEIETDLLKLVKATSPNPAISIYLRLLTIFLAWKSKELEEVDRLTENFIKYLGYNSLKEQFPIAFTMCNAFRSMARKPLKSDIIQIKAKAREQLESSLAPDSIEIRLFDFRLIWDYF